MLQSGSLICVYGTFSFSHSSFVVGVTGHIDPLDGLLDGKNLAEDVRETLKETAPFGSSLNFRHAPRWTAHLPPLSEFLLGGVDPGKRGGWNRREAARLSSEAQGGG